MVSKGPSMTVTDSPTWKSGTFCAAAGFEEEPDEPEERFFSGRPTDGASIEKISSKVSGVGSVALPTKPVTPGVSRTTRQDSVVRSMRTST